MQCGGQKLNLYNLPLFRCELQVHIPDTHRGKLDPKTKDCIFLGYAEGVKVGVFEHVATGQWFVLGDAVVGSVRLNSEPITRLSLTFQGKKATAEVNLERPKEDRH
jgi:hypothetical protein